MKNVLLMRLFFKNSKSNKISLISIVEIFFHFLLNFSPLFVIYKIKAYYYKINGNLKV